MTITIPPETVKAVKELLYPFLHAESDDIAYDIARAACLAMLEAWPGAYGNGERKGWKYFTPAIILPLQENSNERE